MSYLVISCSLNPESRSRVLAKDAQNRLEELNEKTVWLDLAERDLPLCDGDSVYEQSIVGEMGKLVKGADGILLASPIYNYDLNAVAKNFIELTGRTWQDKVVGFLCAAGGEGSFMSPMGMANSLMLDFRCIIIPRFVYASPQSFSEEGSSTPEIKERVDELATVLVKVSKALKDS
jgi:FMN reductase